MRARRVRTVGLRALQLCALFLAGACGASFFKSAHLSEKHLPGQSASTLFEDGQLDISSKVVAGASLGTHHRELQRAAQKVSLRASNTSRATLDALHRALIRGQAGTIIVAANGALVGKQTAHSKLRRTSKHSHRKHAKAKKQEPGLKGTHLDVPLEEVGLSPQAVVDLRARNEQERQARLAEVRAQFYKRRPGLSESEPGSTRGDEMVQEEVARARDAELFKLFSRKHGLSYMQHRRRSKKPESLRLEETAVVREAQKLIQTVEADETRCAKLPANRSVRVIVAGMSVTGRDWLLTTLRALLEAEFGEQALAGSRQSGTSMNGTDALQILSKDQYAVVAMEEFDADLLAAADYIFLVHQDPRTEYGERAQKSAGKSAPQVHRAFLEHGKWARHACSDSAYERAAGDTLDEIHRLATLLCLSSVDPGEIAGVVQEELEKSGRDSPGITMTGNEIAYRRPTLPGEATERIEQAFGVWMTMHGYPVKNHSGQEGLSGTSELLSGNVLRVQNCPRRPERDAV